MLPPMMYTKVTCFNPFPHVLKVLNLAKAFIEGLTNLFW